MLTTGPAGDADLVDLGIVAPQNGHGSDHFS